MAASNPDEGYDVHRWVLSGVMVTKTTKEVLQWYDRHAEMYEKDFDISIHRYAAESVTTFMRFVKDRSAAVLDLGAGTGRLGEMLTEHGYNTIDAIDGSESMLKILRGKQIYRSIHLAIVSTDPIEDLKEGTYDGIIAAAVFGPGTVQYKSIPLLMTYLKKGGYLVFGVSDWNKSVCPEMRDETLRSLSADWEEQGLCRWVESNRRKHYKNEMGSVQVFMKI